MGESVLPLSEAGKLCDKGVKTEARTSSVYSLWTTNHLKDSKKWQLELMLVPRDRWNLACSISIFNENVGSNKQ